MTANTFPTTALGASAGAVFGLLVAESIWPDSDKIRYSATSVVIFGVIGGLIGRGLSTKPNPAYVSQSPPNLSTPPSPPLQQISGGGGSMITVAPGLSAQTVPLNVQDPVLVKLPTGSSWVSMDGAPLSDQVSPVAFVFLGPINHTFVWHDAKNQQYVSSYFFVVAPSATPTTNA